jgi:peptidoglycan hydrolase-like protein with peptidoglycan-binding domain
MLKTGSDGSDVTRLQQQLSSKGFGPSGGADGHFGAGTKAAVMRFQRANGLLADGMVGAATARKLFGSSDDKYFDNRRDSGGPTANGSTAGVPRGGGRHAAALVRNVSQIERQMAGTGRCARAVNQAIANTYGIRVYGNANQIDNNLPKNRFRQVNMTLAQALRTPGLILTWESTNTRLGSRYGHTAITVGDGHTSISDYREGDTIGGSQRMGRRGLKVFMPI